MDLNQRLEQEQMQPGGPKLNPDEQRRFLGTFRERVALAVKASQVGQADIQQDFQAALKDLPGTILIDQNLVGDYLSDYLKIANQSQHPYRIISGNPPAHVEDPNAIVVAADQAINRDHIYLK
ncbi:YueI family protein [Lactobacillaceae bacterium L1_55_11]|nr:YueI family protein [Lactobacillaceae bacterium L1_55_11]